MVFVPTNFIRPARLPFEVTQMAPPLAPVCGIPTGFESTTTFEARTVLVDVRQGPMFDAGHIPGAISLHEISPPQKFAAFLNQQPTNIRVIVYCSSASCSQSVRGANRFVNEFRWPSVRYMTGGYLEYQQAGLVNSTSAPKPRMRRRT